MRPFHTALSHFIESAAAKGLVSIEQVVPLQAYAHVYQQDAGASKLTSVFSRAGGFIILLGTILLISANWEFMADSVKIGGLIALLWGVHALGLWLNTRAEPYTKSAEALHVLGGGLFIAGIALVSQIFNLNGHLADALLVWLIAIAPLAFFLRSPGLTLMSLLVLMLWSNAFVRNPHDGAYYLDALFWTNIDFNAGWALLFLALAPVLRRMDERIARITAQLGLLVILIDIIILGFVYNVSSSDFERTGTLALPPWLILWLAATAIAAGLQRPELGSVRMRGFYVALVAGFASSIVWFSALRAGLLDINVVNWERNIATLANVLPWHGFAISLLAWVLHIAFSLYAVSAGALLHKPWLVNVGVTSLGLFALLRFFDLMGSMGFTGFFFVFGGVAMMGGGYALEKWRRSLLAPALQGVRA